MAALSGLPDNNGGEDNRAFKNSAREQLGRILRSPLFAKAPSLRRFLTYIVEQTLEGDPSSLNEYALGVDVFRRGHSFDPATDTIVRVQARRVRSRVEKYYASEGRADPIVIDLPKGRYAAVIRVPPLAAYDTAPCDEWSVPDDWKKGAPLHPPLPLPAACTSFVGREREVADVKRLLRSEHVRLLTLTGAGGTGKTRLTVRAASDMREEFPGGIYMIPLASIADPGTVASTIAQIIGLRHTGGKPLQEALPLCMAMSVHTPTLLFLDNFEQVIASAPLLTALLTSCPSLKVLVTSRQLLELSGEYDFPVPPLPAPDPKQLLPVEELARNVAVALFAQRAEAVDPAFRLNEDNTRTVAEICFRLDGLPLAIELAAARVKVLPPAAMLTRLSNSLDLLTSGHRDLPARQQALRTTIDWSHTLLSPAEQRLFRRLAVFAGGCTLESAEAVCNPRRDLETSVLDGISSLVRKNLLHCTGQQTPEPRFIMLQTIREYALEQLSVSGEREFTSRAHAAYCIVLAEQGAAQITEEDRTNWLAVWDAEYDNMRAAVDWLIETDSGPWALRLGTALFAFWERREHLAEGRDRLEAVLSLKSAASPTPERARAAWYAAIFANKQGDFSIAVQMHRTSLQIYRELGDRKGIAAQLAYIGQQLYMAGDKAAARPFYEQSLAACRELGDQNAIAGALNNFAEFVKAEGEYALARCLLEEALSIFRDLGNMSGVGWSLNHLGDVAFDEGDCAEACRLYHDGCDTFRRVGDRWGIARSLTDLGLLQSEQNDQNGARSLFEQALGAFLELGHTRGVAKVLDGLACVAIRQGDPNRALTLGGAAEGLRQRVGAPKRPVERARFDRALEPAWRGSDLTSASSVWAEGLRMPLERAIRYALDRPPLPQESDRN